MKKAEILFLVADGFEQSELELPRALFDRSKMHSLIAAPRSEKLRGWHHNDWGKSIQPDIYLNKVKVSDYRALVLPGGLISVPALRINEDAVEVVQGFYRAGKVIGAIGHAVGLLISADVLKSQNATAYASLRPDVVNSGAIWMELDVVRDANIVTAQSSKFAKEFAEEVKAALTEELQAA